MTVMERHAIEEGVRSVSGRDVAAQWFRRSLTGEFAPVLVSLVVIAVVFQAANERFLSADNLSNLVGQIVPLGFIALGVVIMLIAGEIDLSVGIVSGLGAAVMAVLNTQLGWNPYAAVLCAVLAGATVGLIHGLFVTTFGLPSFVVTLAGLLTWQGVMFAVLGSGGTINVSNEQLVELSAARLTTASSYALVLVALAALAVATLLQRRQRTRLGLRVPTTLSATGRFAVLAVLLLAAVAVLNSARGVSVSLVVLVSLILFVDVVARRRRVGRHLFALGGNEEAARRAGIRIRTIRVCVFMAGSSLAALGGVFAASRLLAVSTGSGGGDVLLNAIAAAVIGGTSLFGGRGSAWAALLGAMVIGSVSNGMDLLSFGPAQKFIVTGLVLLAAVTVDATLRGRSKGMT
jgi:D-xylose transport system permease protein